MSLLRTRARIVARDPVLMPLGIATLVLLGFYALDLGGPRLQLLVGWTVIPVLDLTLFALSRRLARLPRTPPGPRRFWTAFSAAGLMFAVGDTTQAVLTFADPDVTTLVPSTVQAVSAVGGAVVVVAVMLSYPSAARSRRARLRYLLDAATMMTGVGVVAWCLVMRPTVGGAGPNGVFTAVVGSGVLLVGTFAAVKLLLSGSAPMSRVAAVPMIVAAGLQGLGNALIPSDGDPDRLPLHMALLVAPCLFIAVGPRVQELRARRDPAAFDDPGRRRYSLLPYAAIVVTFGVLLLVLPTGVGAQTWGAIVGLAAMVVLVVARQLVAFEENSALLVRLDESLAEIGRREHRLDSMLRHSSDITCIVDPHGLLAYVNPALERVLGIAPASALGRRLVAYMHPDDLAGVRSRLAHLSATPDARLTYQARYAHADGSWRWLEVTATNLSHLPGVDGIVSNARDVTDARNLQDLLRHRASHDALTGLANRAHFADRIGASPEPDAAVLIVDLDGFKQINDEHGHHAGDQVLVHVADALRRCLRPGDTAARFGGDEFAVLLPGADEAGARAVADRFRALLATPTRVDGHELRVRASVGVVAGPVTDADALLRAADVRMYEQKRRGRTRVGRA